MPNLTQFRESLLGLVSMGSSDEVDNFITLWKPHLNLIENPGESDYPFTPIFNQYGFSLRFVKEGEEVYEFEGVSATAKGKVVEYSDLKDALYILGRALFPQAAEEYWTVFWEIEAAERLGKLLEWQQMSTGYGIDFTMGGGKIGMTWAMYPPTACLKLRERRMTTRTRLFRR